MKAEWTASEWSAILFLEIEAQLMADRASCTPSLKKSDLVNPRIFESSMLLLTTASQNPCA